MKCLPPYTQLLHIKTWVCRAIHIFLIFAPKHRLWVLVFSVFKAKKSMFNAWACFRNKTEWEIKLPVHSSISSVQLTPVYPGTHPLQWAWPVALVHAMLGLQGP